jgi:hypothetical protein
MSKRGWIQRKTYSNLEDYLSSYGKYIVKQGRKRINQKTKGSGRLARSLKAKVTYKKGDFSLEFKSNKYGVGGLVSKRGEGTPTMRQGYRTYIDADGKRKKTQYKFKNKPPASAFINWIGTAGISPKGGQTIESLAYAISWGVYRQGIPGISFFTQPISATKRLFQDKLSQNFAKDIEGGIITHGFKSKIKSF